MLKQINPEDLTVGQEYYAKMRYVSTDNTYWPLNFIDGDGAEMSFTKNCPIYTLDDQPNHPDPELEMLVNVATALYVAHGTTANGVNTFMPDREEIAREAANLIAACKQIKEGER